MEFNLESCMGEIRRKVDNLIFNYMEDGPMDRGEEFPEVFYNQVWAIIEACQIALGWEEGQPIREDEYPILTECDHCEETKQCRYLNHEDIPVLALCQDCDNKLTNNTNQKENDMKNNTNCCEAIVIDKDTGLPRGCKSIKNIRIASVLVKGGEAVHETMVRSNNMPGWYRMELDFCVTHANQIDQGKRVKIRGKQAQQTQLFKSEPKKVPNKINGNKTAFCGHCQIVHEMYLIKGCYARKYAK